MSEQNNDGNKHELDQNKQERPISQKANVAMVGFFGGFLFSAVAYLAYYFHFMEIKPNVIFSSWAPDNWTNGLLGFVVTVLLYGLISILVAFIYYYVLRKKEKLYVSILFGAALWAIVHFGLVSLFPDMKGIKETDINTAITTACLYIVYGTFIGVSIAYDESERKMKQEMEEASPQVQS
ncbi:YqhR family membrane protein [Bacillus sp. 1P06AnD]|uniref:YqhR family membrane protein n=1 Tax=Bacillus sp. 1P06AnD TaxID=3132208 RepID=UPI0039A12E86